eukprot:CAMPEP_0183704026 /NCGR_PEP_ID=MMETSP0737-20130205/1519_1 /TAXON_ID=385413 /ORGANISM="Thalassiosira miniscula, Strain CCMP1093" /LENGTH=53 /DNA_ID=CAMNT_0025930833 /DNA_START=130 /DNA_END=291 /DNA_ORIENTATION=+
MKESTSTKGFYNPRIKAPPITAAPSPKASPLLKLAADEYVPVPAFKLAISNFN